MQGTPLNNLSITIFVSHKARILCRQTRDTIGNTGRISYSHVSAIVRFGLFCWCYSGWMEMVKQTEILCWLVVVMVGWGFRRVGRGGWSELGNQGAWCQLKCDEVRMHMHVCASKHNNVNEKLAPPPPYAYNIPSLSGRRSRAWRRINARAAYHLYLSLLWFPVITHLFHFTLPGKLRIFIVFSLIQ